MADVQQNIIIEFITDASGLQPSIDQLEKLGKVEKGQAANFKATNDAIKQRGTTSTNTNKTVKDLSNTLSKESQVVKLSAQAFRESGKTLEQMVKQVKSGNVEIDKNTKTIKDNVTAQLSLRSQLRQTVEQLAQMKVNGQGNSQAFQDLAKQAGKLKDALNDAGQEVKNFASDTSAFDGLISLTQGAAGGFAVVQGAAALFGDESEELQKTLLRVNAAMAILQGLQQVQLVLQKESAAAMFLNSIATKAQSIALAAYNFVIGTSTGLTKAFRIALAATGIGLLVIGLYELVQAFKSSNKELEKANDLIDTQKRLMEGLNEAIQRRIDLQSARAKAAGALESEIIRIQGEGLQAQREGLVESNSILQKQRDALDKTSEAWFTLNTQIGENFLAIKAIDNNTIIKNIEFQKQISEEALQGIVDLAQARSNAAKKNSKEDFEAQRSLEIAKSKLAIEAAGANQAKIIEIHSGLNKKLREIDKASREQAQKDILAGLELQLLNAQKKSKGINDRNTQEEVDLQKRIIIAKAKFESEQEGLTQKQILEIKERALQEANKLQKDFSKQTTREILEDAISRNNAELQRIGIGESEKLSFKIDNIILAAQIELDQNKGLSEKIKEINAKRDRDIKEARLESIRATLEFELQMLQVDRAPDIRKAEKLLSDQDKLRAANSRAEQKRIEKELGIKRLAINEEIGLIDKLTGITLDSNFKKIQALNEEKRKGLISQKEYNLRYAQLIEEQTKIVKDGEQKKTDSTKKGNDERIAHLKALIEFSASIASEVVNILGGIFSIQSQQENNRITEARTRIKDLQDAGAITEKEAIARLKKLDNEEKRIKQQQAQRDKALALFNAIISTARGIAAAIPNPFLIALAAAIGAAQIAIIASRPIPKFGKGKKGSYEGLAEVGETGAELVERNGRMHVADKKQVIWLGKKDKVYNPKETIAMMSKPQMSKEMNGHTIINNKGIEIDYEKIGAAVGKHVQTNVFVDGVQEQAIKQRYFLNYINNKRNF